MISRPALGESWCSILKELSSVNSPQRMEQWTAGTMACVGRVGWPARSGGGPGGEAGRVVGGGWIFGVKNVLE